MNKGHDFQAVGPVTEMAIVDTFTKLIFGDEDGFNTGEELIIQACRLVDASVALDSHKDMGHYLRALGVQEMIQLVTEVQACLASGLQNVVRARAESILDRRAH